MPFRFRRGIRLARGVRLNIGRRGVSASIGGRGARVTVGPDGTRATVSTPIPGVSYTTTVVTPPPVPEVTRRAAPTPGGRFVHWLIGAAIALALFWWMGWL
jgi:apolipoprotein N-acyltransferase